MYPTQEDFTNENWGTDFEKVVYDYTDNIFREELCLEYLSTFLKYTQCKRNVFHDKFKIVALLQTHNEQKNISDVLNHLDDICDGVILLDDESSDATYSLAHSKNLLLKVCKRREGFDDLANKNILLNIASFIKCDWLFFIDADERIIFFDSTLEQLVSDNAEAYCFYLVHLWNSKDKYRKDVPESSPVGISGVLHRWRMFKNLGRAQIVSDKKLHFQATPYQPESKFILPVLIVHHGMLDLEVRNQKYQKYLVEDPKNKNKYNYFLDNHVDLGEVSSISSLPLVKIPMRDFK